MAAPSKLRVSQWQSIDFSLEWGKDVASLLADEIDRGMVRTLAGDAHAASGSAVDHLAALAKYPHLPPVLRRFASGSPYYDRDELHREIDAAVRRGPRQFGVVQTDIESTIAAALTGAARGERAPDLHDRVLELMIERGDYNPDLDPRIPEVQLNIRSEPISSSVRKLNTNWPLKPPEPSAVDRLAAVTDPAAAERVARTDKAIALADDSARELRALFDDEDDWGPS